MKHLKKILTLLLILVAPLYFSACKESSSLDSNLYLKQIAYYKVNGSTTSKEQLTSSFTSGEENFQNYSVIQLNTNKDWTYGLTLEKIEFDMLLSEEANVDIEITISNLENGANYNQTQDTYYYHKTLSFNAVKTHVKLDINDIFINKDATISLEVVTSCYESNPNLTLSLNNFKMFGFHEKTNY